MKLILGGARSGKSSFAEEISTEISENKETNVMYVATAIGFDADMQDRIKKHRNSRSDKWITLEKYSNFIDSDINSECDVILLDCMTLMISNLILDSNYNFDKITNKEIDRLELKIEKEIDKFLEVFDSKEIIIVSNEVGLGLVPPYKLGAIFRDIAGRMNQRIARNASDVYFLTAGIPMKIK